MKNLLLALICMSVLTGKVFAKEEVLATITNDENKEIFLFVANSDDSTQSLKAFYKDDYLNGSKTEREVLPTTDLQNSGLVLDKRGDHTVISLKSENFDFVRGGRVVIDTLYNGVTGERKEYELELAKGINGWKLFHGKSLISKLHIEVNKKVIIGTIGVKNIRME